MAMFGLLAAVVALPAPLRIGGGFMDCGTAPLCGVLVLETGLGAGNYKHDAVAVHGLWPETGSYGSSKCVAPSSSTSDPKGVYTCYADSSEGSADIISFETHEWGKHGACAGVKDVDDFFGQVCSLAGDPLKIMASTKSAGHSDIDGYAHDLTAAGFAVFNTDSSNMQVELSSCAGADGKWVLANVSEFSSKCGQ